MTSTHISLWLLVGGAIAVAISYLLSLPDGGGTRYWTPLRFATRIIYAVGAAGAVFALVGTILALPGGTDFSVPPVLVVAGVFGAGSWIIYATNVALLYRDRRRILREHVSADWQRDAAMTTARLRWCARHPRCGSQFWPERGQGDED
jgi:membrane associated rhomboid family serine protease